MEINRRYGVGFTLVALSSVAVLAAVSARPTTEHPEVELTTKGDVVTVLAAGEKWTQVHLSAGPLPYLYPVLAPGGVPVTRGYPMDPRPDEERDHPHHRSLWFAHGDVNDAD